VRTVAFELSVDRDGFAWVRQERVVKDFYSDEGRGAAAEVL